MPSRSSSSVRVFYPRWTKERLVEELRSRLPDLSSRLPLVRVVLFGSYASGRHTAASDIDLLVVHRGTRDDAYAVVRKCLGIPHLEPHVYTVEESKSNKDTIERMTRGGIVLLGNQELNDFMADLARAYVKVLAESLGNSLVSAVLFGSVARSEAGALSDIDLLIVAENLPTSRLARQAVLQEADLRVEDDLRRLRREGIFVDVKPILKTPAEARQITPLYFDLVEDGRILFDRRGFFVAILKRLRRSLKALGARRIQHGQLRYWDLRPGYRIGDIFEV